jgi:hypothetical protein
MRRAQMASIASLSLLLLAGCAGSPAPKQGPAPDDTAFGPKLSEKELKAISELSAPELVDMLRHGDTLHQFAAVEQLTAGENRKKNFDLLLGIAAEGGEAANIIVEGLVFGVEESAGAEDKRMVDKFLDFLGAELQKDQPAVNKYQAIRSVAQAVSRGAALPLEWDTREPPYGYERAMSILTSCLDDKNIGVRGDAIGALTGMGEESPTVARKVLATLEAQLAKEEARQQDKVEKERMKAIIEDAIQRVKGRLTGPDVQPTPVQPTP